jgi:hypothetical protein
MLETLSSFVPWLPTEDRSVEPHAPQVDFQQYRTLLEVFESICAHRDLKALLQELSKRLRSLAQFEFID